MARKVFIKSSFKVLVDGFVMPELFSYDEYLYAFRTLGLMKFVVFFIIFFLKSNEYDWLVKSPIVYAQNEIHKENAIIKHKALVIKKRKDRKKAKKNNKNLRKVISSNVEKEAVEHFKALPKIPETREKRKKIANLLVKKRSIVSAAVLRHKKCPSRVNRRKNRIEKYGGVFDYYFSKGYGIKFDDGGSVYICNSLIDDRKVFGVQALTLTNSFIEIEKMKDPKCVVRYLWKYHDKDSLRFFQSIYEERCLDHLPLFDLLNVPK
jgi:hypothetical protein